MSNFTGNAVDAIRKSTIDVYGADTTGSGGYGFSVSSSSIIDRTNGTGTTSQTLNTWTSNGWIGS